MATLPSAAEQVRHAYARWHESRGATADLFLDMMAPDIEMYTVMAPDTPSPIAGANVGIDAARVYFDALAQDWEMIGFPTEQVVGDGDTVVWIGSCHWRYRPSGEEVETPKVDIWRFRDGKAVRLLEMFDSLAFARTTGLILDPATPAVAPAPQPASS
ncbi:nuclear transport factor 2 family protein [Sphingomonas sp. LaA6.9]|uniref:nuclear transport factor 2 family protein n=1 Tax=Sphingomonas sp. LaA6.9 TaxID=2919914 RepID=UPI001F4F94F4|nr:nuclear transport factor 2 family protein [Sphingomonas sp. LaA6.9]MCJ8156454.1 nuclear transport factor 2 family protein [Sphingomonas sp. LaA6.9]